MQGLKPGLDDSCRIACGGGLVVGLRLSLTVVAMFASVAPAEARGPFDGLNGAWRGGAEVHLTSGHQEALKCNAYYTQKSTQADLGVAIRCASASNRIELRAQLTQTSGRVSGSWEERTYNASGQVTGKASDGKLQLFIVGGALKGSMAITTSGRRQTVSIRTVGSVLKSVDITCSEVELDRGGAGPHLKLELGANDDNDDDEIWIGDLGRRNSVFGFDVCCRIRPGIRSVLGA
jgi:hypothetical protein